MINVIRNPFALLLIFQTVFISLHAADHIHFDMFLLGMKIGGMDLAHETLADGTELYTLDSHAEARILWTDKTSLTKYVVKYKDGKLIESSHLYYENGKLQKFCRVNKSGEGYEVKSYKGNSTFSEVPIFSVVSIYFREPVNVKRLFYEAEGDFSAMKKTDVSTYEFESSDGNRNVYTYTSGQLMTAEFHLTALTVKIKRTSP